MAVRNTTRIPAQMWHSDDNLGYYTPIVRSGLRQYVQHAGRHLSHRHIMTRKVIHPRNMSPLSGISRLTVGGKVSRVVLEDVFSFGIITHSSKCSELVARCNGEM